MAKSRLFCQTQKGRTQCPILVVPRFYGHTNCTLSELQLWLVEVTLTYKGTKLLPVKEFSFLISSFNNAEVHWDMAEI